MQHYYVAVIALRTSQTAVLSCLELREVFAALGLSGGRLCFAHLHITLLAVICMTSEVLHYKIMSGS